MARPLRIEYPGAFYHVTVRGNARADICREDEDRSVWVEVLAFVVGRFGWKCHAYCLMSNHYHLLVETPEPNLSRGMRQLNGIFTQRYNRRHRQVGHLFQGRYKAILVEKESHGLELVRYIAMNPVKAGMVEHPKDYRWSSYAATAGYRKAAGWLETRWTLEQFHQDPATARKRLRAYVRGRERDDGLTEKVVGQLYLGGKEFAEELRDKVGKGGVDPESQRRQRRAMGMPLEEILGAVDGNREERDERIYSAHVEHGYTLAEIGRAMGMHYASISRIVKRVGMLQCKT